MPELSILLSEAELARAVNRTAQYVRYARLRGLISPVGKTGKRRFIYTPDTVEAVKRISVPVFFKAKPRAENALTR